MQEEIKVREPRNLSGIYIQVGKENICFEDLSEAKQRHWMLENSKEAVLRLLKMLSDLSEELVILCYEGATKADKLDIKLKFQGEWEKVQSDSKEELMELVVLVTHTICTT